MHIRSLRPRFFPLVLALTLASACDPDELGFDGELLDESDDSLAETGEPLPDLGSDELELEPGEEEEVVASCGFGFASTITAQYNVNSNATIGSFTGFNNGNYRLVGTQTSGPQPLDHWYIAHNFTAVDTDFNNPVTFSAQQGDRLDVYMRAGINAPGGNYQLRVQLKNILGFGLCQDTVTLQVAGRCNSVGWWYANPWPSPFYDGSNCYVTYLPGNTQGFVWNNAWYAVPTNGNQCAIGSFDGANCYIGSAPSGQQAFIYGGQLYFTP
jgi:hypothetical protein